MNTLSKSIPRHGQLSQHDSVNLRALRLNAVPKKMCIPDQNGYQVISFDEILCLQSNGNYTAIQLIDGQNPLFAKTLKTFEEALPIQFFRIHNQYIVNRQFIRRIENAGFVKLQNGLNIPIARSRKIDFQAWFMNATMISL